MNKCTKCDGTKFADVKQEDHLEADGHTFVCKVPAEKCLTCGETYLDGAGLTHFELRVASILAQSGSRSGATFRFLRKAIGLRAAELAQLLDVTQETISRWETEKRAVDRSALATLGALVVDKLAGHQATLERLQALCKPKRLAKRVRLGDGEAA